MSFSATHRTSIEVAFTFLATSTILFSMMCFQAKASDPSIDLNSIHCENIKHLDDANTPFIIPETLDDDPMGITPLNKPTYKSIRANRRQKIPLYFFLSLGFGLQSVSQFNYALSAHSNDALKSCATSTLARSGGRCFSNKVGDFLAVISVISYTIFFAYYCYLGYLQGFYLGDIYCGCGGSDADQD